MTSASSARRASAAEGSTPATIALLGHSPLFHLLRDWGDHNNVRFIVVTSPHQLDGLQDLAPIVAENLTPALRTTIGDVAFALSFGARWIVKQPIRAALFDDELYNCHGTRLPFDRGGGNWSYRAMRNDRLGALVVHKIDDGIDTGPIMMAQSYVIPRRCQTPAEIQLDYFDRLLPFVIDFIARKLADEQFEATSNPSYLGFYLPRLHTETHGWIDWTMDGREIERFILAFDAPHAGALTWWNGEAIFLKSCQLHGGEPRLHDWQCGTVIRKEPGFLVVALRNGWALVVESAQDQSGHDLMLLIREGDRFDSTPQTHRVEVGPLGPHQQENRLFARDANGGPTLAPAAMSTRQQSPRGHIKSSPARLDRTGKVPIKPPQS